MPRRAPWVIIMTVSGNPQERLEWEERTPEGDRYRVVIAPRGTFLRGRSVATDLTTMVAELVTQVIVSSALEDDTRKVGVIRSRAWGIERFVYKNTGLSAEQAIAEADWLRGCIRRGNVPWRTD